MATIYSFLAPPHGLLYPLDVTYLRGSMTCLRAGPTLLTSLTGPGTRADMTAQTAALARRGTAPPLTETSTTTATGDVPPSTTAEGLRITGNSASL